MELNNLLISKGVAAGELQREPLPELFNNPFSYAPHPLVERAAREVEEFLNFKCAPYLRNALRGDGKMFGVLIVQKSNGETGYLAAYSGTNEELKETGFFVPPVYDLLSPDSFFPEEEHEIIMMNDLIRDLENDRYRFIHIEVTEEIRQCHLEKIAKLKVEYSASKIQRDARRKEIMEEMACGGNSAELQAELDAITGESQFQKGQIRRAEKAMKDELAQRDAEMAASDARLDKLKGERKEMSGRLQQKIFEHFSFLNANGERKGLLQIFGDAVPPGGSGECAAPRLLQYAYQMGFRPVAMGEFWYGWDNTHVHGQFYPSCKGKCGPILGWMLQGLKVDPACFHESYGCDPVPDDLSSLVLYEDQWLAVVNKPAGMLSAPGKDEGLPVFTYGYPVQRLDMHTSGVLVFAKDEQTLRLMQRQFEGRKVEKKYIALLEGKISPQSTGEDVVWTSDVEGSISLPLAADYDNRPMQKVDFESGRKSLTKFRILEMHDGRTVVEFSPITGRTHQLRVHSASYLGLNAPIVGDFLYGRMDRRLMLHARSISFEHPYTNVTVSVSAEPAW